MKLKQAHKLIVLGTSFIVLAQPVLGVDRRFGQFSQNFSTFPEFFNFQTNPFGAFSGSRNLNGFNNNLNNRLSRNFNNGFNNSFNNGFGNGAFNGISNRNGVIGFNGLIPDLNAQVNGNNLIRFGRGNRFEFFEDAQEVAGFSRLLQRGNQLLGQTNAGDHIRLFIDRNGNLVDRTGRRVANRDPRIVKEAQEFFLLNRNKFQGNQAFQIDRFLSASGAFGNGQISVDLASFSLPEKKEGDKVLSDLPPGSNRIQAGLAALNFLLNSIQNRCLVRIFENQVNFGTGTVNLDLSVYRDANGNLCFNGQTLGLIANSDANAKCNGGKLRINELINTMMDPSRYNAAQGIAGLNRTQIADTLGVLEDKTNTFGNKLLVGTSREKGIKQSGVVGGDQRVLERQATLNLPGRVCYRSLDFKDIHEGGAGALARSVEERGILFSHEAEEWLCIGANGFLVTFLFNQNGTLLDEAPGSIASAPGRNLSPAVRNPASCLECHASGFLGGNPSNYEEQRNRIKPLNQQTIFPNPNGGQLTHGDFFINNQQYFDIQKQDSNLFVAAQKASGSFLADEKGKPVPLIPASMEARREPVSAKVMARELGVPENTVSQLFGPVTGLSRTEFENNFCQIKQAGSTSLLQEQEKVLRSSPKASAGTSNPTHK